jgi:hypothetical protein
LPVTGEGGCSNKGYGHAAGEIEDWGA